MINLDESLNEPICSLKGVGKKTSYAYEKLGLRSCFDLICHFPRDYDNCSCFYDVKTAVNGQKCCVKAKIIKKLNVVRQARLLIARCVAVDEHGLNFEVVFFNNDYIVKKLELFKTYLLFGKVNKTVFNVQMISPKVLFENEIGFIPKYSLTSGLNSITVSKHIRQVLKQANLKENLPENLLKKFNLMSRKEAFYNVHFPKNEFVLRFARKRLIFEELFFWQLSLKFLKSFARKKTNFRLSFTDLSEFFKVLPFELTPSQLEVLNECIANCCTDVAMNRLIQGDVGCGKTVVAQAMCFLFARSNFQVALMAPTEILAIQHFNNFKNIFNQLNISVDLLVGSLKSSQLKVVLENLNSGKTSIILGTHSLFSKNVAFNKLGLVITDEQHRFGVFQRVQLAQKGVRPHVLVMSATPVPRTLAMAIFADMDVSVVKKRPAGRAKIKTVHISPSKRLRAFKYIVAEVKKGRQAYIVCPLIEDGKKKALSVQFYFEQLRKLDIFKSVKLEMLHGKLTSEQKNELMLKFSSGEIDVLVATSVVEVGIDNANASVILIENAECFGLASLHQLRGRVGRGAIDSVCVLVSSSKSEQTVSRMAAMCSTNDGFKIAQFDLKLRGPGHFFGTLQHGMPKFKIANIFRNFDVIRLCSKEIDDILFNNKVSKQYDDLLNLARQISIERSLVF